MGERAYNIQVNFKTSTQLEPIKQTEKALKDVGTAGKTSAQLVEDAFKRVQAAADGASKRVREAKATSSSTPVGGGASAGGAGGSGGMADMLGNLGGGLGSLTPMIDMGNAMEQAARFGTFIGSTIGKNAQDAFVRDINFGQALNEQFLGILNAMGVWTEGMEGNIKRIKRESEVFLRDQQIQYQQFKDNLWKAPDDSSTWLKQIAEDAKLARIEVEGLYKIEEIRRRAAMNTQDMLKQDALDALEQSGMSEAEKIRGRQDIMSTDERTRLEIRGQERESRANRSRENVTAAERDYQQKMDIAKRRQAYVSDVVQGANKAISDQEKDLTGMTPQQMEAWKRQQFKIITEQAGVTGLEYGKDQSGALTDVVKQTKEAEAKLREAELQDRKNREAIAEEQRIDEETTNRRIQRGEQTANERAKALEDAAAQEGQGGDATAPEYDRSGEDAARGALLDAAQQTGNASAKAQVEELARALADNNTTDQEKQQIANIIEQVKTTGSAASTALANKLTEALNTIGQNQASFAAALQNLDAQVQQLKSNSAQQ